MIKQRALARLRRWAGADALAERLDALEARLGELGAAQRASAAEHARFDAGLEHHGELERHLHEIRDHVATVERHVQVGTVMDWIARAELRTSPLISVVLPSRNRATLLPRAIDTVLAQSYPHWELLVVDDASTDDTTGVLAGLDDARIRTFTGPGRGVCAARNVAIDAARGEVIAYLDDDNRMHPEWLRSVAWAFEQQPDTQVLYGAFVVDDIRRVQREGSGELPRLFLHRWDRTALERHNLADIGAMAHRAGLPEAHFDEALREMGDWDLLLRLTTEATPLVLPAVACYYESHAVDRLSAGPTRVVDADRVRNKVR